MNNEAGLSVSELNLIISEAVRRDPRTRSVLVRGEVSSFRNQIASGHWYFSLKDANATIPCAMFRGANLRAQIRPKDADQVLAEGYGDFYGPQGKIQLIVQSLRIYSEIIRFSSDTLRPVPLLTQASFPRLPRCWPAAS